MKNMTYHKNQTALIYEEQEKQLIEAVKWNIRPLLLIVCHDPPLAVQTGLGTKRTNSIIENMRCNGKLLFVGGTILLR